MVLCKIEVCIGWFIVFDGLGKVCLEPGMRHFINQTVTARHFRASVVNNNSNENSKQTYCLVS